MINLTFNRFGNPAVLVQGAAQDNSPAAKEDEPDILSR